MALLSSKIFPYVKSYLIKNQNRPLLVEGAGLLLHLVKELECPTSSYLCLTPTADFQKKHYTQREWVPYILEGTTNPEQDFENWMQRDILFAQMVHKEAVLLGYPSLITDGSQSDCGRSCSALKIVQQKKNKYLRRKP